MSSALKPEELMRLKALFERNKWSRDLQIPHQKGLILFDAITEFVASIDPSHRNIAFSLLDQFEIIRAYDPYAKYFAEKIAEIAEGRDKCFVCPVASPQEGEIKSGHNFVYDIKTWASVKSIANVEYLDSALSSKIIDTDRNAVVFVDDFIGTGDQFDGILKLFVKKNPKIQKKILIAIRVQAQAHKEITNKGVEVICDAVRNKAISDSRAIGALSKEDAMEMYLSIEKFANISRDYSLGYGRTEALITLKRTPDNTLPIFWSTGEKREKEWPAPFPRN
jgi:hypothetical protein